MTCCIRPKSYEFYRVQVGLHFIALFVEPCVSKRGSGCGALGVRFRVQSSGFKVWGSWFRV